MIKPKDWDRLYPKGQGFVPHTARSREVIRNTTRSAWNDIRELLAAVTSDPFDLKKIERITRTLREGLQCRDRWVAWFAIHRPEHLPEIRAIIEDPEGWEPADWKADEE